MAYQRFSIPIKEVGSRYKQPHPFYPQVNRIKLARMLLEEVKHFGFKLRRKEYREALTSRPCIYGVFSGPIGGFAPIRSKCTGCMRCVQEFPDIMTIERNPDFYKYGDSYWLPNKKATTTPLSTVWFEAATGKIPVKGMGYKGKFTGKGWDSMWTDMSEIVRPTRDGVHGREIISTAVDIGGKPGHLTFDGNVQEESNTVQIPIPLLFDYLPSSICNNRSREAIAQAAKQIGTLIIAHPKHITASTQEAFVPLFTEDNYIKYQHLIPAAPMVEVNTLRLFKRIHEKFPKKNISLRINCRKGIEHKVSRYVKEGVRVLHLCCNYHGNEFGRKPRFVKEIIETVNTRLIEQNVRDQVSLIVSGGIILAEHIPKAIICGADVVALDTPLLIALQTEFQGECATAQTAKVRKRRVSKKWGTQRIMNLLGSWHNQLIEILSAMGIREVRRLRGERGRGIFFEDIEKRSLGGLARTRKVEYKQTLTPPRLDPITGPTIRLGTQKLIVSKHTQNIRNGLESLPKQRHRTEESMGNPRWTNNLILNTWEQGAAGIPNNNFEFMVGESGGGFDRFGFRFPKSKKKVSLEKIDLSIPLNLREGVRISIPVPFYSAGMSLGSISLNVMLARAIAAKKLGTFMSTGEGGYPKELVKYKDHIITQIATGMFGVREETINHSKIIEFKYAQGAKPGLGGHLLADKVTAEVAKMRGSGKNTDLYSPFPFHSVYSVEDHKKHIDWVKTINPEALIVVKVSTPNDIDMVAAGSYFAGAHILNIDGSYGGTGAAPEIAKKNIAMPLEYALPIVHNFLVQEGVRDKIVIMASGGIRTAHDVAKAIALGADGAVIGSSELVAMGCTQCGNCERGRGCQVGLTTTDPQLSLLIDPVWGANRIVNMYTSWIMQWKQLLQDLGLSSIRQLRGRQDLLVYYGLE